MSMRKFKNLFSTLAALLFVMPLPLVAFTMIGSWRYFASVPGIAAPTSVDSPNTYTLKVSMGQVPPPNINKLTFTATRDFQIENASQLVAISHAFGSLLKNGSINVNVTIERYGVANDPFNFPSYGFSAVGLQHPMLDFRKQGALQAGMYRISLTISYMLTPGASGSWNNSSPHVFLFNGL